VQTQEADRSVQVADRLGCAGLVLDLGAHSLTDAAGAEVALTPSEINLLAALVGSAGRALSRDHLMQAMVGRESEALDRSVARNSGFTYKGRAIDVKQVGREFGV
jgi:DNA-binding response OmpR family regulator